MITKEKAPGARHATEGKCFKTEHRKFSKNFPHLNGFSPKRRNAPSDTRDESYRQILQSGTSISQEAKTFTALSNCSGSQNCRDLSIRTGIEIGAMVRVLFNLKAAKAIYVAEKKPSKHTNRRVEHYLISEGRTEKNTTRTMTSEANTVIVSDERQASLFDNFGKSESEECDD